MRKVKEILRGLSEKRENLVKELNDTKNKEITFNKDKFNNYLKDVKEKTNKKRVIKAIEKYFNNENLTDNQKRIIEDLKEVYILNLKGKKIRKVKKIENEIKRIENEIEDFKEFIEKNNINENSFIDSERNIIVEGNEKEIKKYAKELDYLAGLNHRYQVENFVGSNKEAERLQKILQEKIEEMKNKDLRIYRRVLGFYRENVYEKLGD